MSDDPRNDVSGKGPFKPLTITVSSKRSLWFAWAPANFSGPYKEGEESRPVYMPKEPGATRVQITANASQMWGHSPNASYRSGPDGRSTKRKLEKPSYKSATYNSQYIIGDKDINLNKLLMIRGYGTGGNLPPTQDNPGIQEIVGSNGVFDISEEVGGIFLGMHDGYEWSNNYGSISVTVQWS